MTATPSRDYSLIRVATADHVSTITLWNAARRNAIGPVMANELLHAFADAEADPEVRAVVLTGAGDAFCAGGDFVQMTGGAQGKDPLPHKGDYADLLLAMTHATKPIVARVNGHALGGGLGLVAASHFAVVVRGAKLGTPEINVGIFPMMIMAVLQRLMPKRRLVEMMLFGERLDADHAAALGVVNRAVEVAELDGAVKIYVDHILTKSPTAIRHGLQAFAAQDDLELEAAMPLLRERLAGVLATDDAREGLTAFLEKRPPKWTGN
jgi:enoyl-CoA hydratase/carnithine racemase